MPTVIPAGYSKVIVSITGPVTTHPCSITFGVNRAPDLTLENAILTWINTGANRLQALTYSQYTINAFDMIGLTTFRRKIVNLAGSGVAANLMPPQVCAIMTKNATTRGRDNRGRMYFAGTLAEADVDNAGNIFSGTITSHNNIGANLLTQIAAIGNSVVILHDAGAASPVVVSSITCQTVVGSQRRRQR
jgi:hypothetical protein